MAAQGFENGIADAGRVKNAVDIAAIDAAAAHDRRQLFPAAAHVDLIALIRQTVQAGEQALHPGKDAPGLGLDLFPRKDGVHVQQAHAFDPGNARRLHLVRVGDAAAQHLIAAADAEHQRASRCRLVDGGLQPGLAQPAQVLDGALGARQEDHIGPVQVRHPVHIPQRHVAVPLKGAEVREIGDTGQADHRDVYQLAGGVPAEPLGEAVLVVDVHMGIGHDPHHRHAAQLFQDLQPRGQNTAVTPEFIDDRALDPGFFILLQQGDGTVKLGEHAAPVDVAHQQHRRVHQLGQAHVDNVLLLQVDLGGTACPLDDDDVIVGGQAVVGLQNGGNIRPLAAVVFHGPHIALDNAVDDDLAAHIGGGLQQDGVHAHIGSDAGGLCLHHLGAAHLAPRRSDKGVEGHVLTFEGRHPPAVLFENTAQARRQQAFPGIGHGALDHDAFCHISIPPRSPQGRRPALDFPDGSLQRCGTSPGPGRDSCRSPGSGCPFPAAFDAGAAGCKTADS